MVPVFTSLDEIVELAGMELGASDWVVVDQDRIDRFADVTGDMEWIHVDLDRAAAGPFGGAIAHGFLTLSLIPMLREQIFQIDTPGARLNYGLNRVRFPAPVPVNSRVRATARVLSVERVDSSVRMITEYVIEIEGAPKPACVAEMVTLLT